MTCWPYMMSLKNTPKTLYDLFIQLDTHVFPEVDDKRMLFDIFKFKLDEDSDLNSTYEWLKESVKGMIDEDVQAIIDSKKMYLKDMAFYMNMARYVFDVLYNKIKFE